MLCYLLKFCWVRNFCLNLTFIQFHDRKTSGSTSKVQRCPNKVCLCAYFPSYLIFKVKQKTNSEQSISLTAGWFCQAQRKHFSLRLILHKAPLSTKEPSSRGHLPPWPQVGSHTRTQTRMHGVDPWPPRDKDDLPVDVKSNQSESCCSKGLHPGGWRSNHLTTASKETLAFLNMLNSTRSAASNICALTIAAVVFNKFPAFNYVSKLSMFTRFKLSTTASRFNEEYETK